MSGYTVDWYTTMAATSVLGTMLLLVVGLALLHRYTAFFTWVAGALSGDDGCPSASRTSMFLGAFTMAFGLLYIEIAYGIRVYSEGADPSLLSTPLIAALTTGGTGAYIMRNYKKPTDAASS